MQNNAPPYLSIVLVGRNDNYGGDFNFRLINCLSWAIRHLELNQIDSEIIFVNYNFLEDKEDIIDIMDVPDNLRFVRVRVIYVPQMIHSKYVNPDIRRTVPVFEYIAKNIGIRRAKGQYILAANPDILIHPKIFQYIGKKLLKKSRYYRCDRCDYHKFDINIHDQASNILQRVQKQIFRYFLRGNTIDITDGKPGLFKARMINYFRQLKNVNMIRIEKIANHFSWPVYYDYIPLKYHTNCSGDFMMLHRDTWMKLNGCPENTYLAMHTDSIFVVMAALSRLKEFVFRDPVYHQDHSRRYESDGNDNDPDMQKMFDKFNKDGIEMEKNDKPIIYNDESWGGKKHEFLEKSI